MKCQRLFSLVISILFASSAFAVSLQGPTRVGMNAGKPFIYLIPASGKAPLTYAANGLPPGLSLDSKTGIISGTPARNGAYQVRFGVADSTGVAAKTVSFVVHPKAAALTPIMGWNPWYVWGCAIDDQKIRQAADLLVSSGLAAHGYNYINLDDCWQGKRNAQGEITTNSRFPNMKALADYVHSKGLRIGIYTSPGEKTCAGYEGTRDADFETGKSYLEQDVQTYAKWGMDLIKYDWCIFPNDKNVIATYARKQPNLYKRMSDAINRSSRSMVHMMCQYGENNVWDWGKAAGGNSWRTDHDLADDWRAITRAFGRVELASHAGPGHWNDLDMLMVGKGNWPLWKQYAIPDSPPRPTKLTLAEQKTHLSLWSLMASPLLFSGDLAQLDATTISLLTNDDVLAVNQDPLGSPARLVQVTDDSAKVIARRLSDGSVAVGLFNLSAVPRTIRVRYKDIGLPPRGPIKIRNLWSHKEMDSDASSAEGVVGPHAVIFLKLKAK